MKILKKFLLAILLVFIVANILVWVTGTTYIYKALVYQQVGIDDLDIFETRNVKASKQPTPWPISSSYNQTVLSERLQAELDSMQSIAFLVVKNDSILYEKYYLGYSDTSYTNPFSAAKSVVGLLVGIAKDDGFIHSLEQPVGDFIPEFASDERKHIKIVDVLRMASGTSWEESYSTPFNHTTDGYYGSNLKKLMLSLEAKDKAGTEFYYKSGDTQLLQMIVESATGMTLSDYASKKLWIPLGMERDGLWSLDRKGGTEKAYCCLYSNARDFAKIGHVILCNGFVNGQQVVSQDFLKKATTPIMLPDREGNIVDYYGYQIWLYNYHGMKVIYSRGILGQYIIAIPELNMVVVRLGHKRSEIQVNNHPQDVLLYIEEAIRLFK